MGKTQIHVQIKRSLAFHYYNAGKIGPGKMVPQKI